MLLPIVIAGAGVVLLVLIAAWLLVLLRRFSAVTVLSKRRFTAGFGALRTEVTNVRAAVDQRRTNGAWRFTDQGRARTISHGQE